MQVVIDIEANRLENPTEIWVICCYAIEEDRFYVFRNVTSDTAELDRFLQFSNRVTTWIGHNLLGYDYPVLLELCNLTNDDIAANSVDTLIISKLINYSRKEGHSLESYGVELGLGKIDIYEAYTKQLGNNVVDSRKINNEELQRTVFSGYSELLEEYCKRDVEITYLLYKKFSNYVNNVEHSKQIYREQRFQHNVNMLHKNGFYFDKSKAIELRKTVEASLSVLDAEIVEAFPDRLEFVREVYPKTTKYGTLSKSSIPLVLRRLSGGDLSSYSEDAPFCLCKWVKFNPASVKQVVDVLNDAGWKPTSKTKTHIQTIRDVKRAHLFEKSEKTFDIDEQVLYNKMVKMQRYGWKINEENLATLPEDAPAPARKLAQRILLEARRRTLTEWIDLVQDDGRIHGDFYGVGAWTHRMAHRNPNTANIPSEYNIDGSVKYLGKEMRSLWRAAPNRLLVGVDAEGIQLRIFAHYIDDAEFTDALVRGKKNDGTDPHSLNKRIMGDVCRTRAAAKRYIYALLLGGGFGQLASILGASSRDAEIAYERLCLRYTGFQELKNTIVPADAKRGYFIGLDGGKIPIKGDTEGQRRHLAMSGYLQNGEKVIMSGATNIWTDRLDTDEEFRELVYKLVNMVHDEWQIEVNNDVNLAIKVAEVVADSLKQVGEELHLRCPLAGSYWNDDHNCYTIGTNWYATH